MAVDEALLIDAAEHNTATLRFYSWNEPTLSLGYFQRYADREQHAASRECAVVRRQTGGGAILHDRELTYSLALPASHPLDEAKRKLYRIVHEVFIDVLSQPGHPRLGWSVTNPRTGPKVQPATSLSYASSESRLATSFSPPRNNLKHDMSQKPAAPLSSKILGSAQRRYRGAVLQHGSLLLERSPAAPELAGWRDLADPTVATEAALPSGRLRLGRRISLEFHEAKLPPELESIAAEIANNKYGSPAWTKRR